MKMAITLFTSVLFLMMLPGIGVAQRSIERSSFHWDNLPLRTSLDSLMKWYTESIVYLDKDVEGKEVSGLCADCSFDQALNTVLSGTSLTWIRRGNQIILKEQNIQEARQFTAFSGTVSDLITGEWIVGASILLQDSADQTYRTVRRWCPTNAFGFYSLPDVPIGQYILVIRAIGYETVKQIVDSVAEESVRYNISMAQKDIIVKEVTIEGHRITLASATGFTRSAYRRSVPSDQNQYMLDGGRIYNPAHFGGVLSTFSPEVLTDVQVVMGGLPPYYGGRVGGIVDLSMRDGSRQRFSGSLGLGSLGSNLALEGPFTNNTTFFVSGRRGYPDIGMQVFPRDGVVPSRLGSSELITKITHRFSGSDQVSMSGYLGGDTYQNKVIGDREQLDNNFSWSNRMLDLRWISIATPFLFAHASVIYSRYDFDLQHRVIDNSLSTYNTRLSSDYTIEDWNFNAHAENYYTEDHTLRAGVELIHHGIHATISEFSSQVAPYALQNYSSWEAVVYLQDQWKILPRLLVELGGRATSFTSDKGSFSAIDPRFSLLVTLDEQTHLYSSLSAINQFLHPYRSSGVFLLYPTIFWYPSTEKIHPSTSLHATLGMEYSFMDDAYIISAESYYRIINNLHEFGNDTTALHSNNLEQLSLSGTGKTYGLSCSLRKRLGDVTGSISYNLSWSFESFMEINDGGEFNPPFDRRHELQVTSSYEVAENWTLGALCVVASGQSLPLESISVAPKAASERNDLTVNVAPREFSDVNGSRLPGFQRLELNIIHRFMLRNFPCQFSLRLLNSYGLLDPFIWKLQRSGSNELRWNATLRDVTLFPLYPAVEIVVRF
jgi:hypothetical protein